MNGCSCVCMGVDSAASRLFNEKTTEKFRIASLPSLLFKDKKIVFVL